MNRSRSFAVLFDKLSRIERQSRPKYKSAVPNWFIRRTLHVPNLMIRFGTCKVLRLNRTLPNALSAHVNKIFQNRTVFVFIESWSRDQLMQKAYRGNTLPWNARHRQKLANSLKIFSGDPLQDIWNSDTVFIVIIIITKFSNLIGYQLPWFQQ